jgi:hypothetical protein
MPAWLDTVRALNGIHLQAAASEVRMVAEKLRKSSDVVSSNRYDLSPEAWVKVMDVQWVVKERPAQEKDQSDSRESSSLSHQLIAQPSDLLVQHHLAVRCLIVTGVS